jgi:hypothetical protein
MLLKEARDGFLFDCECQHLAKGSIRNYRAETKFLMEFLELKQITEVEEVKAHHTAAYYGSYNNPKYGKMFNELTEGVKDRELQKKIFFHHKGVWHRHRDQRPHGKTPVHIDEVAAVPQGVQPYLGQRFKGQVGSFQIVEARFRFFRISTCLTSA